MQLAVLGCAHPRASDLLKQLAAREDLKVKSVWDDDEARGQSCADDLEARFFASYDPILRDPEIEAVIVLVGGAEADRVSGAARERGKRIIPIDELPSVAS